MLISVTVLQLVAPSALHKAYILALARNIHLVGY